MNRTTAWAVLLLLGCLSGCSDLFYGFSVIPPEDPPRPPLLISASKKLENPPTGDPAVMPLVEGSIHSSTMLIRIMDRVAPHYHAKSDETVYILEGEGDVLLEREWKRVRAGDLIHVPMNSPHAFVNRAPGGTVVLSTYAPAYVEGDRVIVKEEPRQSPSNP